MSIVATVADGAVTGGVLHGANVAGAEPGPPETVAARPEVTREGRVDTAGAGIGACTTIVLPKADITC
jgi:phosphoribosylaminoimidazole (AIR) synthetase